jgi:exonuclease III
MKIMTFNVLVDGLHEAGDRRDLIRQVVAKHRPDVLCVQEGGDDPFWKSLAAENQFVEHMHSEGRYRPSLFSKWPADRSEVVDDFSPGGIYFKGVVAGIPLVVLNVHLPWKVTQDADRVAALKGLFERFALRDEPNVCICGDFNSRSVGEFGETWMAELQCAAAETQPPVREDQWMVATSFVKERGFIDCFRQLHDEQAYSCHLSQENAKRIAPEIVAALPAATRTGVFLPCAVRIDYIFANAAMAARLKSCDIDDSDLAFSASDHLPFVAEFQ